MSAVTEVADVRTKFPGSYMFVPAKPGPHPGVMFQHGSGGGRFTPGWLSVALYPPPRKWWGERGRAPWVLDSRQVISGVAHVHRRACIAGRVESGAASRVLGCADVPRSDADEGRGATPYDMKGRDAG
jgi:hypothetical protein